MVHYELFRIGDVRSMITTIHIVIITFPITPGRKLGMGAFRHRHRHGSGIIVVDEVRIGAGVVGIDCGTCNTIGRQRRGCCQQRSRSRIRSIVPINCRNKIFIVRVVWGGNCICIRSTTVATPCQRRHPHSTPH